MRNSLVEDKKRAVKVEGKPLEETFFAPEFAQSNDNLQAKDTSWNLYFCLERFVFMQVIFSPQLGSKTNCI